MNYALSLFVDLVLNPLITLFGIGPWLDEESVLHDPIVLELSMVLKGTLT